MSLGCPKNLVDGEVMLGYARDAGHQITADASSADIIVVNTCAFIDEAREESVDAIIEMAHLKRDGRCRTLIVTGCLAERYRDQLQIDVPEIDVVLGTGQVPEIVGALNGVAGPGAPAAPVRLFRSRGEVTGEPEVPTYLYDAGSPRLLTTPRHYAYVKVAEGCDYTCAFCIIPTLRGHYRSRTEDSVVAEAERLAAGGVRELVLISQDTSFFGLDRGERGALARLLRRLDRVDGLAWIRLLYLYPTTITDDVLDAMAECRHVCKYIDLPLQHAAAGVLRRMRRPGHREAYERLLERIRVRVPNVALRTTFIVGFPGETDQDFSELLSFVETIEFDHVGVFTYSHEQGTRADTLVDDVPPETKAARRRALMQRQQEVVTRRNQSRIGSTVYVMVDGPAPESALVVRGRLEGQAPEIDSVVYFSECDPSDLEPGTIITAQIIGHRDYDLIVTPAT